MHSYVYALNKAKQTGVLRASISFYQAGNANVLTSFKINCC